MGSGADLVKNETGREMFEERCNCSDRGIDLLSVSMFFMDVPLQPPQEEYEVQERLGPG